jgi:hypothetical protein
MIDQQVLPQRGRRPTPRYVAEKPCTHNFGEPTSLEEVAGVPPQSFGGRLRFKNEAKVCKWCGFIVAVMR